MTNPSPDGDAPPHLDMTRLRHPSEPSRLALALVALAAVTAVALFVLVSLGRTTFLATTFLVIVLAVILIWVALQVWRIRLLGDAVLVSEQTLPELQELVDTVRTKLGYERRVDLFVVDKMSQVLSGDATPITLTTFFGVQVLVAEGEALGNLASRPDRRRLEFALATYVGALKARQGQWWSPLFTAFQMTGLTVFVLPFVYPYYRATVYSGDRIAYACCGDLDVSLDAVYRALVGKEIAPHLRADGLTGQALSARRRRLLRFAQLLRPTPHATNRYLNLLAFARERTPEAFERHRTALGATAPAAEAVLATLSRPRTHRAAPAVGVTIAAVLLLLGFVAGLTARNSPIAVAIADAFATAAPADDDVADDDVATPVPSPTPQPTTVVSTTPTATPSADPQLLKLVPFMRTRCTADDASSFPGAQAMLTCQPPSGTPDEFSLISYTTASAMQAAFDQYAGSLPEGGCLDRGQGTWNLGAVMQGPLACFVSPAGESFILWGSNRTAVLAIAYDSSGSVSRLADWWRTDAPVLR